MKLTNNTDKLLKILIVMIGFLCTIIFFGILTRSNSSTVSELNVFTPLCINNTDSISKIKLVSFRSWMDFSMTSFNSAKADIKERQKISEMESITPMQRYVNYVYEIATHYPNIPPEYVCAIIYRESRFDPTCVNSKTGVVGLAQINPKWHTDRANALGVYDLQDPYGNILVCFDILDELTSSYNFEYALNFYAGGYPYANRYQDSTSPCVKELLRILEAQDFSQFLFSHNLTEFGGVS